MKHKKIGSLSVSEICLGTMTFGEQNSEKDGVEQLDYALDNGVNFIDTAEMYSVPARKETYGETERIIGNWQSVRNNRADFILASKASGPATWNAYIRETPSYNKKQLNVALDDSLARLKTDYIDLYQLHWPERKTNYFGALGYKHDKDDSWEDNVANVVETLNSFIKEGKIKHYGLSNETAWGAMHFIRTAEKIGLAPPVSIQNPYSLLNRTHEISLAEISIRENIPLLAYSPLAFGLLTGKYINGSPVNARLTLFPKMARYASKQCTAATLKYNEIAKKHNLSLTEMALGFINSRDFIGSNIIGATSLTQLKENIKSIEVTLTKEVIDDINKVQSEFPNPAP